MSRWDALKPDSWSSRKNREAKWRQDSTVKPKQSIQEPPRNIAARFRKLQANFSPENLYELATLVKDHATQIPCPEETATIVVQDVFLCALEDARLPDSSRVETLKALGSLLKDGNHASAILASLTNNVSSSGQELAVSNPVRIRLFEVLQELLFTEVSCIEVEVCTCLTTALQATERIDDIHDLDIKTMERYFKDCFAAKESVVSKLELLLAVMRRHSSFAPALFKILLLRDELSELGICQGCGVHEGLPPFLDILHRSSSPTAARCFAQIICNIPLDLWLPNNDSRASGFQSRVLEAIKDFMKITNCSTLTDASYCILVEVALLSVPYKRELDPFSFPLARRLATFALKTPSAELSKITLMNCFGGKLTPQGKLTKTSETLTKWLRCKEGKTYVDKLVECCVESSDAVDILGVMIRVDPATILNDEDRLEALFLVLQENPSTTCTLLEKLVWGRKNCSPNEPFKVDKSVFVRSVLSILENWIRSDTQCRLVACTALGDLSSSDWAYLASLDQHLGLIVSLLADESNPLRVKVAGWKSTGLICEHLFTGDSCCSTMCNVILTAILRADDKPSIQCMVWFTFGNLMKALCERGVFLEGIDMILLVEVIGQSERAAAGTNEKVATNAFRSTGFAACLALKAEYSRAFERIGFDVKKFHRQVLQSCNDKIRATIQLSSGEIRQRLSWKERLGLKKQGRVACSTLALLFKYDLVMQSEQNLEMLKASLLYLRDCIDHYNQLEEKFASSAFLVLRSVDTESYARLFEDKDHFVGKVAVSCCMHLFFQSCNPARICHELELLLGHVLTCLSESNAKLIVHSLMSCQRDGLILLYDWMVEYKCPSESFWSIANAMRASDDPNLDVIVEQGFSSRSLGHRQPVEDEDEI